jgi:hypothetical protein
MSIGGLRNIGKLAKTVKPNVKGCPEVTEIDGFVGMTVRGEIDNRLLSSSRHFEVRELARMLKPIDEGGSKIKETGGFVGVTVRCEIDGPLLSSNCCLKINELAQTHKPTDDGPVTKPPFHVSFFRS